VRAWIWVWHCGLLGSASLAGTLCATSWLLHGRLDAVAVLAYGSLMWLMNLGDRLVRHPEDAGDGGTTPALLVLRHRRLFGGVCGLLAALLFALVLARPWLLASIVFSGTLCTFYFVRLPGLGRRIKELSLAKPLVVPLLMLCMQLAFCGGLPPPTPRTGAVCLVLLLQFHAGLVLYDLKDLEQDVAAGIRSLASRLTRAAFLRLEAAVLGLAVLLAAPLPPPMGPGLAGGCALALAGVPRLRRAAFGPGACIYFDGVFGLAPWLGLCVLLR